MDPVIPLDTSPKPEECGKALPRAVLFNEFVFHDPVGFPYDLNLLTGNFSKNPDCEAGTGKGHPVLDLFWQAKGSRHFPYFVLIEITDRFDHPGKFHMEWHTTDIMVPLDTAFALDPVRIDGCLKQARCTLFPCLPLKNTDKPFADCRKELRSKGTNPHLLVMTATPIPRSLALTVFGDLDISVIDEMPVGRQPVSTHVLRPQERERAFTLIRGQIRDGRQAFIVYPLIDESEKIEARAAVDDFEALSKEIFPNLKLNLLHGRMKPAEKDEVMLKFRDKQFDILVSTTVVEVGVDVPNSTVMLIEGADRFGLAQLHQLRGRVGRGAE